MFLLSRPLSFSASLEQALAVDSTRCLVWTGVQMGENMLLGAGAALPRAMFLLKVGRVLLQGSGAQQAKPHSWNEELLP